MLDPGPRGAARRLSAVRPEIARPTPQPRPTPTETPGREPRLASIDPSRRCVLNGRLQRVARNITSILVEAGVVTQEQVELGVLRQRETGLRIGETLVEMGAVTEEDVGWALSRQLGLSFVDIEVESLDPALVRGFDETLLRRGDAVPLLRSDTGLSIAVADPTDDLALDRLEAAAGVPLQLVIGTPTAIHRALDHVLGARRPDVRSAARPGPAGEGATPHYDVVWERSGETFLAFHVASALRRGAAEIHFLPGAGQLRVHYRVAGRLVEIAGEPERLLASLLARLEVLGGPTLGEGFHARGRVVCPLPAGDVILVASLLRALDGVTVTLSLPEEARADHSLESLGVDPGDAAELREALATGAGLVLVGGPPSSGGGSLLAALAEAAGTAGARVVVLESERPLPLSGATRLALSRVDAASAWPEIAVAQGADVLVLDQVLLGEAIVGVLDGAAAHRLVLARTDWCDSGALLDRLLAERGGRPTLAPRLLALLQARRVHSPDEAGRPPLLVETLVVGDAVRDAIGGGADAARAIELARSSGFRTLAERGAERLAAGTLEEIELRRACA